MSLDEVQEKLTTPTLSVDDRRTLQTEFHKRWALAVVCPIFALLGVGLGTTTNRRNQKSGGLILCLGIVIAYWILYVSAEGLARGGQTPVVPSIWFPNIFFLGIAYWALKKNWN